MASDSNNPIIPRHALFGNADKIGITLSPDSRYISYLAPKDGVMNIWIADKNDMLNVRLITNEKARGIHWYAWTYDNKHIIYTKDDNGDENFRLYAYNIITKKTTLLTPESGVRAELAMCSLKKPHEIIVSMNARDKRYFDIYKINLLDYSKELVFENNMFAGLIIDDDFNLRFATRFDNKDNKKEIVQYRDGQWLPFMTIDVEDSSNTGIVGFNKANTVDYLRDSRGRDTTAIKALDLDTRKITTIASSKLADVNVAARHPTEKNIQMVSINYDKLTYKVLDKSIAKDIKYLQSMEGGYFTITNRTNDDKIWLVVYYKDTAPPRCYIYDRTIGKAQFLFSLYPMVEQYNLSPMQPAIIKSRDGLKMVSYLTVPQDKTANTLVPMVLLVHGGPHVRDTWGLNPVHQWLANRGYAVLSVNYRGSSGFGKKFLTAGYGQWGRKMQDDLIDAVNWAIKNKVADPNKICIMGGSYGGYATLAGLAFTPDVFACGIDMMGISNLKTFMRTMPTYWSPAYKSIQNDIGNPDTEEGMEDLRQRSPLTFAHNIKKPLLIGQGANDPRVKQAESDQIVQTMKNNNIPVIYALYNDEGHNLSREGNRLSFFAMTEEFLASVLGGRAEPIGDDFKKANFSLNDGKNPTPAMAKRVIRSGNRQMQLESVDIAPKHF